MGFFDYFFGSKIDQNKPKQQAKEDQTWIYDIIYQHLSSPIWKITVAEFMDDNCIYFDEEEGNKLEYQAIFKEFKKLMSQQFDTMIQDIGITEQQLAEQIFKGLAHPQHKHVFQQLLVVDDYSLFKKQMIQRNKELELEALKELEKIEQLQKNQQQNNRVPQYANQNNLPQFNQKFEQQRLEIENEKAQLELAIELSKKAAEEQKKMLEENDDKQLLAILAESLKEHNEKLKQQLAQVQQKEEQMKQMPQYQQSQMLKSIKQINYPTFESYKQRQKLQEMYPSEDQEESTILKVELNPRCQFEPTFKHNIQIEEKDDLPQFAPVIAKVESELIEEDYPNELQEQKFKIQQQKEYIIRKKSENNKSELLKLKSERSQNVFKTYIK